MLCQPRLKLVRSFPGKALYVEPDGTLYLCRHYTILVSRDDGASWTRLASLGRSLGRRLAEVSRLACRLLRHEIRTFLPLAGGAMVAATREGIYYGRAGDSELTPSCLPDDGSPFHAPMSLTAGPQGRLLCGEYWGNKRRQQVRLYVSDDSGRSFHVFRVFEPGLVKHVHNMVFDSVEQAYWVLVGDHREEPGIARLSLDLKDFEWVVKGRQEYRAVRLFDFGDSLIYGTDSEMAPNAVMRLEKRTGRIERLAELSGSCIYACRFGRWYALSTSVEPSPVNSCREAGLWLSRDGYDWQRVLQAPKDRWSERYFQFGSLVLPYGESDRETIFFSGQALVEVDGRATIARLDEGSASLP